MRVRATKRGSEGVRHGVGGATGRLGDHERECGEMSEGELPLAWRGEGGREKVVRVLYILQLKNICVFSGLLPNGNIRVTRQGRRAHVRRRSRDRARPAARPSAENADAAVAVHARTHYAHAHVLNRALNVNTSATTRETTGLAYSFYCWSASPCIPTCHLAACTLRQTQFYTAWPGPQLECCVVALGPLKGVPRAAPRGRPRDALMHVSVLTHACIEDTHAYIHVLARTTRVDIRMCLHAHAASTEICPKAEGWGGGVWGGGGGEEGREYRQQP